MDEFCPALSQEGIEGASDLAQMFDYPFEINIDDTFLCEPETAIEKRDCCFWFARKRVVYINLEGIVKHLG